MKNRPVIVDTGWRWFYTARPHAVRLCGEGDCGWALACLVSSMWEASGLSRMLFGNLVEASVASNETDASQ